MKDFIIRHRTLCSWCRWGNTLPKDDIGKGETWCSCDQFEVREGENNWPKVFDCTLYERDKNVYEGEMRHWQLFWAAGDLNRAEIDKSVKRIMNNDA